MSALALSYGWYVGWSIGLVVVLLVASLLLVIIGEGKRITRQAVDITKALDGTKVNTDALWDVRATNHTADRITRYLAAARRKLF